jgi:PIN domain nuclease of toxin-antitoxin system
LLDTHILLWLYTKNPSLSHTAHRIASDLENEVLVSAASAWEIALKVGLKKLPEGEELVANFFSYLERAGLYEFSVTADHGIRTGLLPPHHKDPFDRLLAAQCQAESIPIISNDKIFDLYGVRRIW